MKIAYTLTPKLAAQFKEPFGTLIEGTASETMAKLRELISKEKPPMLIAVGDVVSRNMHAVGLHPLVAVIDNISLRGQTELPPEVHGEKTVHVQNPQGTLTEEAIEAVRRALLGKEHTHIVVEGEEDLLVITAVQYAPQNSFVVYGQPRCGVVVVKVSPEKKAEVKGFLNDMKPTKS
jgi:GTP-dependent dephospho-CoA kinase